MQETISYLLMINEPNGPPSDWSPFTHKDKLASGRGGVAYFVIVTNSASRGGGVASIVTNPASGGRGVAYIVIVTNTASGWGA